ncbi:MAG: DUF1697 domain-containing protein, partial [Acidimicrobiia bacterium]
MPRYVAFLRAINLPGRNVKMDRLRATFVSLGLDNVDTFIASGNVIFDSDAEDLTGEIEAALEADVGFPIPVYLRTADEVIAVADSHPFAHADGEMEVSFLPAEPDPEAVGELIDTATGSDRLAVALDRGRRRVRRARSALGRDREQDARLDRDDARAPGAAGPLQ